jgi:hypothetical protein
MEGMFLFLSPPPPPLLAKVRIAMIVNAKQIADLRAKVLNIVRGININEVKIDKYFVKITTFCHKL